LLENRRCNVSIERLRKYHQTVPTTPQTAQANQPYSAEVNITLKAIAEIGRSATHKIPKGKRAGPSSIGLLEIHIRTEVVTNKRACNTGTVNRARRRFSIAESYLTEGIPDCSSQA